MEISDTVIGAIVGGIFMLLAVVIPSLMSRRGNLAETFKKSAEALDITTDQLIEALNTAKDLRDMIKKKDALIEQKDTTIKKQEEEIKDLSHKLELLTEKYYELKHVTFKLVRLMESNHIDTGLSRREKDMLIDTDKLKK